MLCVLFFCVLLWEKEHWGVVCGVLFFKKDISFSHRAHWFNRTHLRTVSIPQKASGIQNTQNVTANEDTNKKVKSSLHPVYRGISVITPLPFGGGEGGGASWGRGRGRCCSHSPLHSERGRGEGPEGCWVMWVRWWCYLLSSLFFVREHPSSSM